MGDGSTTGVTIKVSAPHRPRKQSSVPGWVMAEIIVPMLPALLHFAVALAQHNYTFDWPALEREAFFGPELPFLSILLCATTGMRVHELHGQLDGGKKRTVTGFMGIASVVVVICVAGGLYWMYSHKDQGATPGALKWIRAQEVLAGGAIILSFLVKFGVGLDGHGRPLVD